MRILISGAAGFLGSHLTDLLLSQGHEVVGVDNFITGKRLNIAHLKGNPRFTFVEHDVIEPLDVGGDVGRVYHMASPASPIGYVKHQVATLKVNSQGTWNLLELAVQKEARFLMASTSECYGDPAIHPQPETYWGNVNPIGPRMDPYDGRVVISFIRQALNDEPITVFGDGRQTRSLCYVFDLVRGINLVMEADFIEPINLGNPQEITIIDIAREVLALIPGSKSKITYQPMPPDDPRLRKPDITRARQILGWYPKVDRREGLASMVEYYRDRLKE